MSGLAQQLRGGLKLHQGGDLEGAAAVYRQVLALRPDQPDALHLLGEILRRDPAGVLVLMKPEPEHLEAALRSRFRRTMGDVVERIHLVPRMPHPEYLNLVAVADVLLDPRPYDGGVTSYDGLSLGKPIVTFPTEYQRGRYVLGFYRKMEILDCVTRSAEEYAELAPRLGTNQDFRRLMGEKILAASHVLFEDSEMVRQHEDFFERAIGAARSAEPWDAGG